MAAAVRQAIIDIRPILLVVGILLTVLAAFMLVPMLVDLSVGNPDWQVFMIATGVTLFAGLLLFFGFRGTGGNLTMRQAFLLSSMVWVTLPAFAALPFAFSALELSAADAYFEAMSGITTTGSTVIVGLEQAPPGLLVWRSILQWLGGLGIIVMALTLLPLLKVGGMQLFRVEAFDTPDKVLPRAVSLAAALLWIYLMLTISWAVMYWAAGMSIFDAANHAMTTIATGGYSTRDASLGAFQSDGIHLVATAGMLVSSLPFLLYLQALNGRPLALLRDTQVQAFMVTIAVAVALIAFWLFTASGETAWRAFVLAAFNTVSVMTGTGFATADYWAWGGAAVMVLFAVQFIGGCAGSTTCGIKVFRFQVLFASAMSQLRRLIQPHRVVVAHYNHRPLEASVVDSVMAFFFLYAVSVAVLAALLGLCGLDMVTALSGAATAISNVGPGMGPVIGPAGTFAPLPDVAKWLLSIGMLLGRLELFTLLVLLTPTFWRQ